MALKYFALWPNEDRNKLQRSQESSKKSRKYYVCFFEPLQQRKINLTNIVLYYSGAHLCKKVTKLEKKDYLIKSMQ